jgi:hypothetical protein
MTQYRKIISSCNKCGAAANEYCKHTDSPKPKTAQYEKYQFSEQSLKAIDEWLQQKMTETL